MLVSITLVTTDGRVAPLRLVANRATPKSALDEMVRQAPTFPAPSLFKIVAQDADTLIKHLLPFSETTAFLGDLLRTPGHAPPPFKCGEGCFDGHTYEPPCVLAGDVVLEAGAWTPVEPSASVAYGGRTVLRPESPAAGEPSVIVLDPSGPSVTGAIHVDRGERPPVPTPAEHWHDSTFGLLRLALANYDAAVSASQWLYCDECGSEADPTSVARLVAAARLHVS